MTEVAIPLLSEQYYVSSVGELMLKGFGDRSYLDRDKNVITYNLMPFWHKVVDEFSKTSLRYRYDDEVFPHYEIRRVDMWRYSPKREGVISQLGQVALVTSDHSFARGLIRKLLNWDTIVSVSYLRAREVNAILKKNGTGNFVATDFVISQMTGFSVENEEDAHLVKMTINDAEVRKSKVAPVRPLPFS